jgi:hypothetical protein
MKTLLSIIVALALLFAFSLPAMATPMPSNTVDGNADSALANEGSNAINQSHIGDELGLTLTYTSTGNVVAKAELSQVNTSGGVTGTGDAMTAGYSSDDYSSDIEMSGINKNFAGIANANLNTGVMNNQGIQNTFAISAAVVDVDSL